MASIKDELVYGFTSKVATFTVDFDVSAYRTGFAVQTLDLIGAPTNPTVDTALTHSVDGTTFYALPTAWAFAQKTADGSEAKAIPADTFGKFLRFTVTIAGTSYAAGSKHWNGSIKLSMSK